MKPSAKKKTQEYAKSLTFCILPCAKVGTVIGYGCSVRKWQVHIHTLMEKKTKTYFGQFSRKLKLFPVKMSLGTSKSDCGKSTFFEIQNLAKFRETLRDSPSFAGTRLKVLRPALTLQLWVWIKTGGYTPNGTPWDTPNHKRPRKWTN